MGGRMKQMPRSAALPTRTTRSAAAASPTPDAGTPDLVSLYRALILPRLIEDKMLRLLRQGKLSKWFSGIGQEAIAVGVTTALEPEDFETGSLEQFFTERP